MTDEREIIIERQRDELEALRRLVVDLQGQLAQTQAHRAKAWDEVMRRAVRDVLDAPTTARDVQLFRTAVWALGVAEGLGEPAPPVEAELWAAAQSRGLTEIEIRRTLTSARIRARR